MWTEKMRSLHIQELHNMNSSSNTATNTTTIAIKTISYVKCSVTGSESLLAEKETPISKHKQYCNEPKLGHGFRQGPKPKITLWSGPAAIFWSWMEWKLWNYIILSYNKDKMSRVNSLYEQKLFNMSTTSEQFRFNVSRLKVFQCRHAKSN